MLTSSHYRDVLKLIRIALIILFCFLVFWLIKQDIAFSGKFAVEHDYSSPSPFFTELVPTQRVALSDAGNRFIEEPIYTTLRYPRPFQELQLNLTFDNPDNLFVEFGPQIGLPEVYKLQALNHPLLNTLLTSSDDWDSIGDHLYQKRFTDYSYDSVDQFTNALPPIQSVGYYGVDWQKPYLPEFSQLMNPVTITTPLRGTHHFYLASNQPYIDLDIDFQDINATKGKDFVSVQIKNWDGTLLEECLAKDDGEEREKGVTSKKQSLHCEIALASPQVVIVSIETTDDIIFHSITSSTPYIVAKDHLRLAGGNEYLSEFGADKISSVEIVTSARSWGAMTTHRSTLQSLRLVREQVALVEPYQAVHYQMPSSQRFLLEKGYSFITEKGNVIIDGRGVYALPGANYFSPKPWLIDSTTDPQVIGINYLLTDYVPPIQQEDGSVLQKVTIDLATVFAPTKALRFQWSLPTMEDKTNFVLKTIQAQYKSEPITLSNIQEKFSRFIEREF